MYARNSEMGCSDHEMEQFYTRKATIFRSQHPSSVIYLERHGLSIFLIRDWTTMSFYFPVNDFAHYFFLKSKTNIRSMTRWRRLLYLSTTLKLEDEQIVFRAYRHGDAIQLLKSNSSDLRKWKKKISFQNCNVWIKALYQKFQVENFCATEVWKDGFGLFCIHRQTLR